MNNQLTMKNILDVALELKRKGLDLSKIPIYIGNDDELNGVHNAWYCNLLDSEDKREEMKSLVEFVNINYGTTELKGKGILIS